MSFVYVPITIGIYRGECHIAEFDCEARVDYELPDGPSGVLNFVVTAFHFVGASTGRAIYAEIGRTDPLFKDLYDHCDREWIHDQAREALARDGICNLYMDPDL